MSQEAKTPQQETKEEVIRKNLPAMLQTVMKNSKPPEKPAELNSNRRSLVVPSSEIKLYKYDKIDWDEYAFAQTDVLRGNSIILVVSEHAFLFAQFAIDETTKQVCEKLLTIRDRYMTGVDNCMTTFDNWFFAPFVRIYVFLAVADARPSGVPPTEDHTSIENKHFIQPDHAAMLTSEVDRWKASRAFLPYILPADDPQAQAYIRLCPVKDHPERIWQWPEVTVVSSNPDKDGALWVTDYSADGKEYPPNLKLPYIDFIPGEEHGRLSK
ncbi:hypothetical protein VTN96DRAFT_5837 [Rasamsonia emersonii]